MHKIINLSNDLPPSYLKEVENFIDEWESQATYIEVQTSGSTGKPKTIRHEKSRVLQSAIATGKFFNFKPDQTLLLNLSPAYIAGKLQIVRALVHGMQLAIAPLTQNPLAEISSLKIDFAAFVPYQVQAILANAKTRNAYEKIDHVIIGGAPMGTELTEQVAELSNQNYSTFGMTETITHIALKNITARNDYYITLPGIKVETDDRNCLVIEENPISDRLVTNDLVELINENKFVWLGRIDNVVNSAGVKLIPEELERKIAAVLAPQRYYFKGLSSTTFGEELVLYVEGQQPNDWDEKTKAIQEKLERYEFPKKILFIDQFAETATGKLLRCHF